MTIQRASHLQKWLEETTLLSAALTSYRRCQRIHGKGVSHGARLGAKTDGSGVPPCWTTTCWSCDRVVALVFEVTSPPSPFHPGNSTAMPSASHIPDHSGSPQRLCRQTVTMAHIMRTFPALTTSATTTTPHIPLCLRHTFISGQGPPQWYHQQELIDTTNVVTLSIVTSQLLTSLPHPLLDDTWPKMTRHSSITNAASDDILILPAASSASLRPFRGLYHTQSLNQGGTAGVILTGATTTTATTMLICNNNSRGGGQTGATTAAG